MRKVSEGVFVREREGEGGKVDSEVEGRYVYRIG